MYIQNKTFKYVIFIHCAMAQVYPQRIEPCQVYVRIRFWQYEKANLHRESQWFLGQCSVIYWLTGLFRCSSDLVIWRKIRSSGRYYTTSVHFGLPTVYINNKNIDFGGELFKMFSCLATWILVEKLPLSRSFREFK